MNEPASHPFLHPPLEPYRYSMLDVGDGHRVYFEECGNPLGMPLLFLHGGPGSGASPRHRQLFDPQRFRMVLFDQRGCGRSQPRGCLQANTSDHLVADIERLRQHLGLDKWLVAGGSWGAGLALAYAAAHPEACSGLLLRGVFLGRNEDLEWFFHAVRQQLPDVWTTLGSRSPVEGGGRLLGWLAEGVVGQDEGIALERALAWEAWEHSVTARRAVGVRKGVSQEEARALVDKYRVQGHYLLNGCFWGSEGLLHRLDRLVGLPVTLVHGRQDWVCRPEAAWVVHQRLPGSRLVWVEDAGHNPYEPAMARACAQEASRFLEPAQSNGPMD